VTKRPHISAKTKVDVALRQAFGCAICPLCRHPLLPEQERLLEHMVPFAWTQGHITEDLAWVHKPCADLKTYGNKATCADGDIHKIAKAKRLAKKHSQPKPPGTMKSRGFQGSRKFNGEINWRTK
jgi:hypothetical protein